MRIISHGVDIVQCSRIEQLWKGHGEHFLNRVYTPAEQRYCLDTKVTVQRLSGRFAVKEAVMKCLGTGWRGGIEWTDIETLADPLGRPLCTLRGKTAELARSLGIEQVQVSISHAGEYALATALGLGAG
ncbi:MAG TPA: holo-ACP synthase [Phycisphaerae bacterium]|nr:holo-ACP synthase [Phycisphaerae bacterium]